MPTVTMIAGPNGSGKSTLTDRLVAAGIELGDYFNADDLARGISGDPDQINRATQQEVRDRRDAALSANRDHAFETVMSHPSHIEYLLKARALGFETRLLFVSTDSADFNVGRVASRVRHGGHDVPPDRIVARYRRCLANLPQAIGASDHALIFDNSYRDRPFLCLAEIRNGTLLHLSPYKTRTGLFIDLPQWWRGILHRIKPTDPFRNGPLG